jgi:hypothetical protein
MSVGTPFREGREGLSCLPQCDREHERIDFVFLPEFQFVHGVLLTVVLSAERNCPFVRGFFLHAREALAVRRRPRSDVRRFRRRVVLADAARLRTDEVQVLAVLLTWLALPKHAPPLPSLELHRLAASRSRGLSGWLRVQRGM